MEKRKNGLRQILLLFLLSTSLCLPLNGWAGNPPTEGSEIKTTGPAIVGTALLVPKETGVNLSFEGQCKGTLITWEKDIPSSLAVFTKEYLEGLLVEFDQSVLGNCLPSKNQTPYNLTVNVTKYKSNSNSVTADVVLLFAVY